MATLQDVLDFNTSLIQDDDHRVLFNEAQNQLGLFQHKVNELYNQVANALQQENNARDEVCDKAEALRNITGELDRVTGILNGVYAERDVARETLDQVVTERDALRSQPVAVDVIIERLLEAHMTRLFEKADFLGPLEETIHNRVEAVVESIVEHVIGGSEGEIERRLESVVESYISSSEFTRDLLFKVRDATEELRFTVEVD